MRSLIITLLLLATAPAQASLYSWTLDEQLALARCLVAEAPMDSVTEQAAVAHVLVKRWRMRREKDPVSGFGELVKGYCAIFKLKQRNPRQRWIMSLPFGPVYTLPPDDAKGELGWYEDKWQETLNFVSLLAAGNITDPTPEAMHWGNEQDHKTRVRRGLLGRVKRISGIVEDITCAGRSVILKNFYYVVIDAHPKKAQGKHRAGQKAVRERKPSLQWPDRVRKV